MNFILWFYGIGGIFQCNSIQEQVQFYHKNDIENKFKKIANILCNSFILFFVTTFGVPKKQFDLLGNYHHFICDLVKYLIFNCELKKNYFYYPYCSGSFSEDCCPDYLKEENKLAEKAHKDFIKDFTAKMKTLATDELQVAMYIENNLNSIREQSKKQNLTYSFCHTYIYIFNNLYY